MTLVRFRTGGGMVEAGPVRLWLSARPVGFIVTAYGRGVRYAVGLGLSWLDDRAVL